MKKLKQKQKEKVVLVIAIGVMLLLFYSSSQPYEKQSAVSWIEYILPNQPFDDVFRQVSFEYGGKTISVLENGYYKFIEFFFRKFMHFTSFFVLGYSWLYTLVGKMKDKKMAIIIAVIIGISYAAFDEFHQYLTPQRTALLEDVILDSSGVVTGILTCILLSFEKFKRR